MSDLTVTGVTITPVAFRDPPLLNQIGVHEPFAVRAIVEVITDGGIVGLGETYGDAEHLEQLRRAGDAIVGCDVFALTRMRALVAATLAGGATSDTHGLTGQITPTGAVDRVYSPLEVGCLDAQGRALGRPVSDLLGGAVRDKVRFSAYLFWKWRGHPGQEPDDWGEALTPEALVAQARTMLDRYGFHAIKLKGGVFAPEIEIEAIRALRGAFPGHPLRLDPNGAWTPATAVQVATALEDSLEYLEDPTIGITGMAEVARQIALPLATNMCLVDFAHIPEAFEQRAVQIVLSDHHYWGGLTRTKLLADICVTFGVGLSMHSNSHLGVSLAAMIQLGASLPELTYDCDTHWPWKDPEEDVIVAGALAFRDGAVRVPTAPGLGVELDRDALARLHEQYLRCGIRTRDDTAYLRSVDPGYERRTPRW